jgi:hypothetical protein
LSCSPPSLDLFLKNRFDGFENVLLILRWSAPQIPSEAEFERGLWIDAFAQQIANQAG